MKEGVQDSIMPMLELHALVPELLIWECDFMVYEAGWLQDGIVAPAQLGTAGYLFESPDDKWYSEYWQLIWDGALDEARAFWKDELRALGPRSSSAAGPRCTRVDPSTSPTGGGVQARGLGDRAARSATTRTRVRRRHGFRKRRGCRSAPRTRPAGMAGKARVPAIASS